MTAKKGKWRMNFEKKRFLRWLLCVVMVFSLLPQTDISATTGDVNLSKVTSDMGNLDTDGYHWDNAARTLTLNNAIVDGTLTLPDRESVKVVTNGDSTVQNISFADEYAANVEFSGNGKLTVQYGMNSGQATNISVAKGAEVEVSGMGINIGTSGGVDSTVTVNGKLTAGGSFSSAVSAGKVTIGSTGYLCVSGYRGVKVNGVRNSLGSLDITNAFSIENGGRFSYDCVDYGVMVFVGYYFDGSGNIVSLTDEQAEKMLVIPDRYIPDEYATKIVAADNGGMLQQAVTIALKDASDVKLEAEQVQGAGGQLDLYYREPLYELTVVNGTGSGNYKENTEVTITANEAPSGQQFKSWSGLDGLALVEGTVTSESVTFTMPANAVSASAVYEDIPHVHNFSNEWTTDESSHWHVCDASGCDGTVSGKAVHTESDWIIDKEADTENEGTKHKECTVCKYVMETVTIPKVVQSPNPSDTPAPSNEPNPGDTPSPSDTPAPSNEPNPSDTPSPSNTPAPSNEPNPSDTPAPSDEPQVSGTPTPSTEPQESDTPAPSSESQVSAAPESSDIPQSSETPTAAALDDTTTPEVTATPQVTVLPETPTAPAASANDNQSAQSDTATAPKTGDNSPIAGMIVLFAVSGVCLIGGFSGLKKKA